MLLFHVQVLFLFFFFFFLWIFMLLPKGVRRPPPLPGVRGPQAQRLRRRGGSTPQILRQRGCDKALRTTLRVLFSSLLDSSKLFELIRVVVIFVVVMLVGPRGGGAGILRGLGAPRARRLSRAAGAPRGPLLTAKYYTRKNTKVKFHWNMPPTILWKMPLKTHVDFRGVDFWCAIFCPYARAEPSRGRAARASFPARARRIWRYMYVYIYIYIHMFYVYIYIYIWNWSTGFLDYILPSTPGGFRIFSERTNRYSAGACAGPLPREPAKRVLRPTGT